MDEDRKGTTGKIHAEKQQNVSRYRGNLEGRKQCEVYKQLQNNWNHKYSVCEPLEV